MTIRSMFLAIAAALLAALILAPLMLPAQETSAEFLKARQEFVAGQLRPAANTLLMASVHVRQEVGRSHDEVVGMKLLDAEGDLEKLASALRSGSVASVKTLDQKLTAIDRLLAQHHLQRASEVIAKPHVDEMPMLARDVDRAAFHFERSITLDGHAHLLHHGKS